MVWQFDFSEYETTGGGTWRVGGIADYWSKYEFGWHWSPTANQHDAIAAVELALAEAQRLLDGPTLLEHLSDPDTGEIVPITLVTDIQAWWCPEGPRIVGRRCEDRWGPAPAHRRCFTDRSATRLLAC